MSLIDLETDPGTGLLFIGFVVFIVLGLLTLSGTIALLLWAAIGIVVALGLYGVGVRVTKWLRGESEGE